MKNWNMGMFTRMMGIITSLHRISLQTNSPAGKAGLFINQMWLREAELLLEPEQIPVSRRGGDEERSRLA